MLWQIGKIYPKHNKMEFDAINEMDHSEGISHETIIEKYKKKYA